jgi:hypothetical protein
MELICDSCLVADDLLEEGESAMADQSTVLPFAEHEEDESPLPSCPDDDESLLLPCPSTCGNNDQSLPCATLGNFDERTPPSALDDERGNLTHQAKFQVPLAPKASPPVLQGLSLSGMPTVQAQPILQPQLFHVPLPYPAFGPFVAPVGYAYPVLPIVSQHANTRKRSKPQVEFCCMPMRRHVEQGKTGRRPHSKDCPKSEKNKGVKRQRKSSK